jgi:hypothetical protein
MTAKTPAKAAAQTPANNRKFLVDAGIDPKLLTDDEADELDTLLFRRQNDLPFGIREDNRMHELKRKANGLPARPTPPIPVEGNFTMPVEGTITVLDPTKVANLVFHGGGKEVLRITPEGELIFANPSEAAEALLREWKRLRGEA